MTRSRRRLGRFRWFVASGVALVLVFTLAGGWIGLGATQVRADLAAAAGLLRQLQLNLEAGDVPSAGRTLAALQRRTRAAVDRVHDPVWAAAAGLPGPARNLVAVRTVTLALDDLAHNAMPPLVEAAGSVGAGAFAPWAGQVDLGVLRGSAPRFEAAHLAMRRVLARVEGVPAGLVDRVGSAVAELRRHLTRAVAVTDAARRASALLPAMLGADGPRTYLLLFQNPAEVRATGGMPGAFAVVGTDRGKVRLIAQGTASNDLGWFDAPVLPVEPELLALYGDGLASHPANINLTPHFPTTAALAREMYRRRSGRTVDGVLATDPVTLGYLLGATGPIPVPGGETLTSDNAVRVLLADVYARFPSQEKQDAYFARAAQATFEALVRGAGDGRALLGPLTRAATEHRILVWSARPQEQAAIAGTALEGALPADDAESPTVGVFLNDGGASKLGYYLSQSAELATAGCGPGARQSYSLSVTLASAAPRSRLPAAVLSYPGVPDPYTARTYVSVVAPVGWGIIDASVDGTAVPIASGRDHGRFVALVTLDVSPEHSRTLTVRLLAVDRPGGEPVLRTTPMVATWKTKTVSADRCGK